jgi:hypothetical protein
MPVNCSQPILPSPRVLTTVPGTPRKAFQRLIKRYLMPSTPSELRPTTVILEALERAGVSRHVDDSWLLAIDPDSAELVHT